MNINRLSQAAMLLVVLYGPVGFSAQAQSATTTTVTSTVVYDMVQLQTRPQTIEVYQNLMTPVFFEDQVIEVLSGNGELFTVEVNQNKNGLYLRGKIPVGVTDMYVTLANGMTNMFVINAKPTGFNPKRVEVRLPRDAFGNIRYGNSAVPNTGVPGGYGTPYLPYSAPSTWQSTTPGGGGGYAQASYTQSGYAQPSYNQPTGASQGYPYAPFTQPGAAPSAPIYYPGYDTTFNQAPATGYPAANYTSPSGGGYSPLPTTPVTAPMTAPTTPVGAPASTTQSGPASSAGTQSNAQSSYGQLTPAVSSATSEQSSLTTRVEINAQGQLEVRYTLRAGTNGLNFKPSELKVTAGGKALRYKIARAGGTNERSLNPGDEDEGLITVDNAKGISEIEIRWTARSNGGIQTFTRTFDPARLNY